MYFINQIFVARRLSILISKRIQSNIFIITKKNNVSHTFEINGKCRIYK